MSVGTESWCEDVSCHASEVSPSTCVILRVQAIALYHKNGIEFGPAKAANAGGVAVSGLEMAQNSARLSWSREEVDDKLKGIMKAIFDASKSVRPIILPTKSVDLTPPKSAFPHNPADRECRHVEGSTRLCW